jgi:hypothetical protein
MATALRTSGTKSLDPNGIRDFGFEWDTFLGSLIITGQSLSASEWTVPSGITKVSDTKSGTKTIIRMSGSGTAAGEEYVLANKITTSGGEVDERSLTINIVKR